MINLVFDLLQLDFKDIVEILILTIMIYKLIILLRTTRGTQILLGIFVLAIVWFLALVMGFETIYWIINSLFSAFIILIIVLFQDDIRKLLTTVGSGRFVKNQEEDPSEELIKQVMLAVKGLSHERLGALIVFEGDISIERLYTNGVDLNAKVTEPLLICIFQSFSPLHDGAVIIRQNAIHCASAHLPLTKKARQGKKQGTRHSAALGISEQADVVVLVVSEETGTISIAVDGELFKQPSVEEAQRVLMEYLMPKRKVSPMGEFVERYLFSPMNRAILLYRYIFGAKKYEGMERRTVGEAEKAEKAEKKPMAQCRFPEAPPQNIVFQTTVKPKMMEFDSLPKQETPKASFEWSEAPEDVDVGTLMALHANDLVMPPESPSLDLLEDDKNDEDSKEKSGS